MGASFLTTSGRNPVEFILSIASAFTPCEGDVLYAAQRQRTRIVDRTLAGVDVDGQGFEPYDTTRPYYYYPNGRVGRSKATQKQTKAAVKRFLKKTGDVATMRWEYLWSKGKEDEAGRSSVGGVATRSGMGIRFESYADFKESLGRAGVDLLGPRAPHMLQAIGIRAGNRAFASVGDDMIALAGKNTPVSEFAIGIYGEPAGRAQGHNSGYNPRWNRRHQRYFLGASVSDFREMILDIETCMMIRLKGKL